MEALMQTILCLSIGGTLMALMLCGIRLIFGAKLPSAFYYYAWLLVLLRFTLPLPGLLALPDRTGTEAPETLNTERDSAALVEMAPEEAALRPARRNIGTGYRAIFEGAAGTEPEAPPLPGEAAQNTEPTAEAAEEGGAAQSLRRSAGGGLLLTAIWAAGAAVCFARYIGSYAHFSRKLKKSLRPARESDRAVLAALGGGKRLRLGRSAIAATPMLVGILRPKIILPDRDYDDKTLANILRHELTHYRRHDVSCKWFAVIVYSCHWFNPATRLVRRELDRDCELSCDERLLRHMDGPDKQSYGETLLNLAADRSLPRKVVATTFATEKRNLKERLVQIMTYKKKGRTTIALMLAMLLLLCACGTAAGPAPDSAGQTAAPAPAEDKAAPTPMPETDGAEDERTPAISYTNNVTASTVDEFLAAIAPDTCITLELGVYDLSKAADYGKTGGEYYVWTETYDGYELIINNVRNLRINGTSADEVILSAQPRYADVLGFRGCENISIDDITLGHTEEPGACAGGVLEFQATEGVLIDDCALYGCGILGVTAYDCINVRVEDTEIYDCSSGAAYIESCYNVSFDDCEIYECMGNALFTVESSSEVAILNSEIYKNTTMCLVMSDYSEGVYLGGVKAENNSYTQDGGVLFAVRYPIVVDGCDLGGTSVPAWFLRPNDASELVNAGAVSPDGEALTGEALAAMERRDGMTWKAKETVAVTAESLGLKAGEDGALHVSTVDEFLAAIAPDTTIYLEEGEYDLSTATAYGSFGGKYYSWQDTYDGPQLVIANADNLTITGEGAEKVSIAAIPRYADVLHFTNCDGLTLMNFTAGHTQGPSQCAGDVLWLDDCDGATIEGCSLYGCGVIGISAYDSEDMEIRTTEIYECSSGAVRFYGCVNISMDDCNVHDNGGDTYAVYESRNITVNGTALGEGITR